MIKIPFYKPSIGPEEIDEVTDTLKSGWLTTGPKTKKFESAFAGYLAQKHAIALNSCTAALHLALESIGLRAGETVVVPTMTFAATAEVVRYFGARPLLVDCRSEDFNLDVADAERKITAATSRGEKVVAIVPVHYGGQVGDIAGVKRLASTYQLKIIEDAAHCCPAYYRQSREPISPDSVNGNAHPQSRSSLLTTNLQLAAGKSRSGEANWLPVGNSADISCFSFYANKTITTGEGGMACTDNDAYAERMRIMSLHGISRDAWKRYTSEGSWYYEIIAPGYKYNMTDIAAAIGLHQLRKADAMHQRRTTLAGLYELHLKEVDEVITPHVQKDRIHSWHLYVIRLRLNRLKIDRAEFITELQRRGIGVSVHWLPLHMHPYYREAFGYTPQDLLVSSSLYQEIITLPLYPAMNEGEVSYVCDGIKEIVTRNLRLSHSTQVQAFQS